MKDPESQEIFHKLSADERAVLNRFVPKVVDSALHWLLCLLDGHEELRLSMDLDGKTFPSISAISDGLPGEAELKALRRAVNRGSPFGTESWSQRTIGRLGLESTIRPRGRPKKQNNGS